MSLAGLVCAALFLLADVSGSVEDNHYILQRDGTAAAFESEEVLTAVARRPVAVAYAEFSHTFRVRVEWRVLQTPDDARRFAADLRSVRRSFAGSTDTGNALEDALRLLGSVPCDAVERTIDVVSDGAADDLDKVHQMRDRAVEMGVRINALAIYTRYREPGRWMAENVVTPEGDTAPAGFVIEADGWDQFRLAFRRKLIMEIGEWVRPATSG